MATGARAETGSRRAAGKPEVRRRFQYYDQLSDAARSAPCNIAEGFARYRHKEFAQFVRIAKGSEAEVLNHSSMPTISG
jgi:four helix bundle protein